MSKTRDNFIGFAMDQSRWNNLSLILTFYSTPYVLFQFWTHWFIHFLVKTFAVKLSTSFNESFMENRFLKTLHMFRQSIILFWLFDTFLKLFLNFQVWPSQDNCSQNGKWRASLRKGRYFDFVFQLRFLYFFEISHRINMWLNMMKIIMAKT